MDLGSCFWRRGRWRGVVPGFSGIEGAIFVAGSYLRMSRASRRPGDTGSLSTRSRCHGDATIHFLALPSAREYEEVVAVGRSPTPICEKLSAAGKGRVRQERELVGDVGGGEFFWWPSCDVRRGI